MENAMMALPTMWEETSHASESCTECVCCTNCDACISSGGVLQRDYLGAPTQCCGDVVLIWKIKHKVKTQCEQEHKCTGSLCVALRRRVMDCDTHPACIERMLSCQPQTLLRFLRGRDGDIDKAEDRSASLNETRKGDTQSSVNAGYVSSITRLALQLPGGDHHIQDATQTRLGKTQLTSIKNRMH
eukprot:4734915-Amphidinium_carterae.1